MFSSCKWFSVILAVAVSSACTDPIALTSDANTNIPQSSSAQLKAAELTLIAAARASVLNNPNIQAALGSDYKEIKSELQPGTGDEVARLTFYDYADDENLIVRLMSDSTVRHQSVDSEDYQSHPNDAEKTDAIALAQNSFVSNGIDLTGLTPTAILARPSEAVSQKPYYPQRQLLVTYSSQNKDESAYSALANLSTGVATEITNAIDGHHDSSRPEGQLVLDEHVSLEGLESDYYDAGQPDIAAAQSSMNLLSIGAAEGDSIGADYAEYWALCGDAENVSLSEPLIHTSTGRSALLKNGGCLYQTTKVDPLKHYTLSCYQNRLPPSEQFPSNWAAIELAFLDADYNRLASDHKQITARFTQQVSGEAPKGTVYAMALLYSEPSTLFDTCDLVETLPTTPPKGTNLILHF